MSKFDYKKAEADLYDSGARHPDEIYEYMEDDRIKAGFHELYQLMNGVPLERMDEIINPVCFLSREHELSGFVHGVQIGMLLAQELEK